MSAELSLFKELRLRTPADTICRVVALFAVGLSKNEIEKRTGVKGETVHRIIKRLVTCPDWRQLRRLIKRKTGISYDDLHRLVLRNFELEYTGNDLLHDQGIFYSRLPKGVRAEIHLMARKILRRNISFGAGSS